MNDSSELARRILALEEGAKAQNLPQLAQSSVQAGAINTYDEMGQLIHSSGVQWDGTGASVTLSGPTPASPLGVDALGSQLAVQATWDGSFDGDGVAPMDFARVEIHRGYSEGFEVDPLPGASTRVGTIESPGGGTFTWHEEPGDVWVTMITRSLAGKESEPGEYVQVTVLSAVDPEVFDLARKDLDESKARLDSASADLSKMNTDLYDPDGRVSKIKDSMVGWDAFAGALQGYDNAITDISDTVSTAQNTANQALSDATTKADAARTAAIAAAASDAQTKADAAKNAAISAAATDAKTKADAAQAAAINVANGKADVLIQNTTPSTAYQKATTLWIDTTNGANTPKKWTGSTWQIVTDKAATDAASAAVAAQNTANAAQTAAATAQSTANAAQTAATQAATKADAAQTTASGKNSVVWNTSDAPASAPGTRAGDVYYKYQLVNNKLSILASWQSDGTNWKPTVLNEAYLPQVNIGVGTYGELDGMRLKANSVQANSVLVQGSIGTTLIADGAINSQKANINDLSASIAKIMKLDVSQLVAQTGTIADAVVLRLWTDIFKANRITANQIDASSVGAAVGEFTKVKAENILAGFINTSIGMGTTGSIIAGDWSNSFARMDKDGFSTVKVTPDGTQYVATQLGSPTSNSLTISGDDGEVTAAIASDGSAALYDLDVQEDPSFLGRPLLGKRVDASADDGILDDAGRGLVAWGDLRPLVTANNTATLNAGYTPLAVVGFEMSPYRMYQLHMSYRYDILNVTAGKAARAGITLNYTYKRSDVGEADEPSNSSTFVGDFLDTYTMNVAGTGNTLIYPWPSPFGVSQNIKVLVSIWSGDCQLKLSAYNPFDWKLFIVDVGPKIEDSARLLDVKTSGQTTSDNTTTTAPPPKKQYVSTWMGTMSAMYNSSGNRFSWSGSPSKIQHGSPTGTAAGMAHGVVCFTSNAYSGEAKTVTAALTGATVTKVEVYVKFPHWWNSNGGSAVLRPLMKTAPPDTWAPGSIPSGTVTKKYTARGQGYWITVPNSWISTTSNGITIGPASNSSTANYGYWYGPAAADADKAKLRVTYTR